MSEETKQNEGEDRQEQSELSDDQLEQAAGGAQVDSFNKPQEQLKVEEGEKIIGSAEVVGNNFEEIKVTYTENDSKG